MTLPLLAAGRNVLSFEAMPRNAQLVNASVHHNRAADRPFGKHVLVNKAVVSHARYAEGSPVCLFWPPRQNRNANNQGAIGIRRPSDPLIGLDGVPYGCLAHVGVTTIDAELDRTGLRNTSWAALKADCETCEEDAFEGASRHLFCGDHPPSLIITEYFEGMTWLTKWAADYGYSDPGGQNGDARIRHEARGPRCDAASRR